MNDFERSLAFEATNDEMGYIKALPHTSLPSFAVVIPSFNQVDFLAATLDSVVTQRYPNVEIYVADGGSTDGSLDVLEQYSKRYPDLIRYDSRPDGGHYMGVNKE
jgi:glycosyltransferase involved in cell wall biosynthesis